MSVKSTSTKALLILETLYLVTYSIFLIIQLFSVFNFGTMNSIFYVVILITLIGLCGLWKQKKIFNKSFWKYFSTFQLLIALSYFYTIHRVMIIMNPLFLVNTLLFLPLYFAILFYTNKSNHIWSTAKETEIPPITTAHLRNNVIFFVGLILVTVAYNPFLPEKILTPAAYNSLGVQAGNRGDLFGEKRFYMMGIKAAEKMGDANSSDVGKIYINLSSYYNMKLDFKASILYATKAINTYESLLANKKIKKTSGPYTNLGYAYYAAGVSGADMDTKQKVLYLNKAMTIFTELKDNKGLAMCNQGMSVVYARAKDYPQSKVYFEKAEKIATKYDFKDIITHNYSNFAQSLLAQKKYVEAEQLELRAINILKKTSPSGNDTQFLLGNAYIILGEIYQTQGKCEEATKNYSIGLPIVHKIMPTPLPTKLMIKLRRDQCEATKTEQKK